MAHLPNNTNGCNVCESRRFTVYELQIVVVLHVHDRTWHTVTMRSPPMSRVASPAAAKRMRSEPCTVWGVAWAWGARWPASASLVAIEGDLAICSRHHYLIHSAG